MDDYRFNPCFSGLASATHYRFLTTNMDKGFNPCFSGLASATMELQPDIIIEKEFQSLF